MNPILYEQDAFEQNTLTPFSSQGIGVLADALSCVVIEEINNAYDLEMTYPVTGVLFNQITLRRIIKAKPNQTDDPQPFRIYKISKPMNGAITVQAHHISYDLSGMVVTPFTVNTPGGVVAAITGTAIPTINPFNFTVNSTREKDIEVETPISGRAVLSRLIGTFGVELSYDVTNIRIDNHRGADNGVVIAYGKNLLDLKQEENCAEICTAVYPYYHSEAADVTLTEKTIPVVQNPDFNRVIPLDLTSAYPQDTIPTENDLRTKAQEYIAENNLGVPKVNLDVSYLAIEDTDEAELLHMFEQISLGDTVTVRFEKLDIDTQSRCVKIVYDSLLERIDTASFGDVKETFTDTIVKNMSLDEEIREAINGAVAKATSLITNGLGGYVMLHKSNPNLLHPDELLILGDSPDLNEATHVWRWNKNGLAYSNHGYNPPYPYGYKTAITSDGQINADSITTGTLVAIEIYNHSDTEQATFHVSSAGVVTATKGTIGGFHIDATSLYNNSVQLHNTSGLRIINNGQVVGRVAAIGNDAENLAMVLQDAGQSISWCVELEDGTIAPILSYTKGSNELNCHVRLNMHDNYIGNVKVDKSQSQIDHTIRASYVNIENHPTDSSLYILSIYDTYAYFNNHGQYLYDTGIPSSTTKRYTVRKA